MMYDGCSDYVILQNNKTKVEVNDCNTFNIMPAHHLTRQTFKI